MEKQRVDMQSQIDEYNVTLNKMNTELAKQEGIINELEATLAVKEDVEEQLATWKEHHDSMEKSKEELQGQLNSACEYIGQLEEKYYESQQKQLDILTDLKAQEAAMDGQQEEIEQLRQYIIDLKSRIAVYIPAKNDLVDKKLAEYINNYPDRQKLKIMFMRESEGVYQFGTKRIYVKCVKDKIEIKVGGGWLSVDEFLD